MNFFKKKKDNTIIIKDEVNLDDVIAALAELEPKKVDRVVALAKSLREYNQKLGALKKGMDDYAEEQSPITDGFLETEAYND